MTIHSTVWSNFRDSVYVASDPWLSELSKYAASLALPPHGGGSASSSAGVDDSVNIGQWWEQKGGPHLAKGGSVEELQKMMDEAKIPKNVQKRFMTAANERYAGARQSKWRSDRSGGSSAHGGSSYGGYSNVYSTPPDIRFKSRKANIAAAAVAAAIGAGSLAHTVKNFKQKGEPEKPTFKKGLIGSALVGAPLGGQVGWGVGRAVMQNPELIEQLGKLKMSPKKMKILTHLIPAGVALAAGTAGTLGAGAVHGATMGLNKLEKYDPSRGQERIKELKELGPYHKALSAFIGSAYTGAAAVTAPRYAPAIALAAHGTKMLFENTAAGAYHEANKYNTAKKRMKKAAEALLCGVS